MRPTNDSVALDQMKAIDEKIRSVLMALSFFVAGMVTVVYATRIGSHPPKSLTWDGHARNATSVFMVVFGGSVFFAVMWALVALDPETYRPMFVIGDDPSAQWSPMREVRFKAARFAESQAFVSVIIAASVLLGITQLPTTSNKIKSYLVCVALVTFAVAPTLASIGLWWSRAKLDSKALWYARLCLFYIVVPVLAIAFTLLAFWHGSQLKWLATIYTLFWLLAGRLVQHRTTGWSLGRVRLSLADSVAIAWLLGGLVLLILAATNAWPSAISLDTYRP